jgi:hypothetical protein
MLYCKILPLFLLSFSIATLSIAALEEGVLPGAPVSNSTNQPASFAEEKSLEDVASQNAQSFIIRWKKSLQEAQLLKGKRIAMKAIFEEAEDALEELIRVLPPSPDDIKEAILHRRPPSSESSSAEESSESEEDVSEIEEAGSPSITSHTQLWKDVLAQTQGPCWALTADTVLVGLGDDIERHSLERLRYEALLRHKEGSNSK